MWYHVYNVRHHTSKNPCLRFLANNDVDGRKHKHILEVFFFLVKHTKKVTRALRLQANIPIKFWEQCIVTTVYSINR